MKAELLAIRNSPRGALAITY